MTKETLAEARAISRNILQLQEMIDHLNAIKCGTSVRMQGGGRGIDLSGEAKEDIINYLMLKTEAEKKNLEAKLLML